VTIATRVRDCRYSKGWGPDELASRAEISRTALYQIECGKTETPRASTLRRIAKALDVTIEALLGRDEASRSMHDRALGLESRPASARSAESWSASELASRDDFGAFDALQSSASGLTPRVRPAAVRPFVARYNSHRDDELLAKFQELLASPLGDGLARLIEESHRMPPQIASKQLG
jgi:transcriptional regulator with XRE-family HTH domain